MTKYNTRILQQPMAMRKRRRRKIFNLSHFTGCMAVVSLAWYSAPSVSAFTSSSRLATAAATTRTTTTRIYPPQFQLRGKPHWHHKPRLSIMGMMTMMLPVQHSYDTVDALVVSSSSVFQHAQFLISSAAAATAGAVDIDNVVQQTSATTATATATATGWIDFDFDFDFPFTKLSENLFDALDVGRAIEQSSSSNSLLEGQDAIPESTISRVLESLGRDLLLFLSASVFVTLLCQRLSVTPILGYLVAGALLGPHGWNIFASTTADIELGDFGILFLLFSEGLEVSTTRLRQLTRYLPLGFAQIALCTGVISAAIIVGSQQSDPNPIEAVVVAIAGTLSTSAFVFPVLKERGWEDQPSGEAATSILLLQDLMVAPLLVLLPYLVGQDATDYGAIAFLTIKAVVGFGSILYVGRTVIAKLFEWVSTANSAETFVALTLLVSAGMGTIAKSLGLTDTAGAFAAGVLLANTGYRAQIQADILPFKGILLGIFFMDAGSNFDTDLALASWPTILAGVVSLILLKAGTMALATRVPEWMEPNRLSKAEGVKLAVLLSGGGEFAFVVLALAERLGVVSVELSGLLTVIVLITMGLTPVLGELAAVASVPFFQQDDEFDVGEECRQLLESSTAISSNPIVVCGYGDVGHAVLHSLANAKETLLIAETKCQRPNLVAFDKDPLQVQKSVSVEDNSVVVLFGDGSNPSVIRSSGIETPQSFFVCYEEHNEVLAATSRLHSAFPTVPIFVRAQTRKEAESLKIAGATDAVVELDELARSAPGLLRASYITNASKFDKELGSKEQLRRLAAVEAGITVDEVDCLLDIYTGLDQDANGVQVEEVITFLRKSNSGLNSDDEIAKMETWFEASGVTGTLSSLEFFQLYGRAPDYIEAAFGCQRSFESDS